MKYCPWKKQDLSVVWRRLGVGLLPLWWMWGGLLPAVFFLLCLDLLGLIRHDMIETGTFVLMVYLMNTFPMSLLTTDTTLLTFKLSYVHYTQLLPALQTETITRQGMINYTPKKNEKAFIWGWLGNTDDKKTSWKSIPHQSPSTAKATLTHVKKWSADMWLFITLGYKWKDIKISYFRYVTWTYSEIPKVRCLTFQ